MHVPGLNFLPDLQKWNELRGYFADLSDKEVVAKINFLTGVLEKIEAGKKVDERELRSAQDDFWYICRKASHNPEHSD